MTRWIRLIAVLSVLAVVGAGCGDAEESAAAFKQCKAGEVDGGLA